MAEIYFFYTNPGKVGSNLIWPGKNCTLPSITLYDKFIVNEFEEVSKMTSRDFSSKTVVFKRKENTA